MAEPGHKKTVLQILESLRGLDDLKQLFWTELNYERESTPLSDRGWPDVAREALAEAPLLLAGGGTGGDFHVIYNRLKSEELPRGLERQVVNQLLKEHPYALLVFSNERQNLWHFLNVKYDNDIKKRRLFRRITVRPGDGLRTAAERIAMLDLESIGPDLFGLSPLAIQARYDEAFDVESVTKAFYKELANWYFWAREIVVFPKDAKPDADGKPRPLKEALKDQYECYTGTADLYVYFFERSLQLLRTGGVLSFITSNKYFRAGYGERLRAYLAYATNPRVILDFGDAPVFTSIAYPAILVTQKTRHVMKGKLPSSHEPTGILHPSNLPPEEWRSRVLAWSPGPALNDFPEIFDQQASALSQRDLKPDGWRLESPVKLRLLERLRKAGTPLGEYVQGRFYRGITTGLNEAFVVNHSTRDRLINEHPSSKEVLKQFLRGRDVKRWRCEPQDLWLIFARRGIDIKQYPAIHDHLKQFKKALTPGIPGGRKPGSYEWYEIQDNIAYWQEFEQPKVIFGRFMDKATYAFDDKGMYHNDALYFASRVTPFVAVVTNSPVNWWFLTQTCTDLQNGYLQALRQYQEEIPIPPATPDQQCCCERLAEALIWLHGEPGDGVAPRPKSGGRDLAVLPMDDIKRGLMVAFFEQWLNGLVYELFFPDELHACDLKLFDETAKLNPPDLAKVSDSRKLAALQEVFDKAHDDNQPLREALEDLRKVEEIRIIEELGEGGISSESEDKS